MVVQAMKAGAVDFIEKPIDRDELFASLRRALEQAREADGLSGLRRKAPDRIAELTPRQHQILELVLAGQSSKNIAVNLGINQRTVENHRARIAKGGSTLASAIGPNRDLRRFLFGSFRMLSAGISSRSDLGDVAK
jgi:FixJ family two-component response regulator